MSDLFALFIVIAFGAGITALCAWVSLAKERYRDEVSAMERCAWRQTDICDDGVCS